MVLNIGKLAGGGERYYLDTVASGVEDYYTGAGEAPGYWLGSGADDLDLAGEVHAEVLRRVLTAADPQTGERLTRAGQRRIPGFDLTFRAPKSVSLLYGLGDESTGRTVRDAHDRAVAAAVGYLEREAGWSRRGTDGHERVRVRGFVAAGFRHRSSRAGDPLLHTHVLVANVAQTVDDGRWLTLDARQLYRHAKTAGYLYQAQLRHELTRSLGVEWGPVVHGCADIAGIPREVIVAFSQRRVEIEQRMADRGESSARAAQVATLDTRQAKDYGVIQSLLRARWHARSATVGFTADHLDRVLDRAVAAPLDPATVERLVADLAGPAGLSAQASTFTAPDVVRAICERLPDGADAADIDAIAAAVVDPANCIAVRVLAPDAASTGEVIRRSDGRLVPVPETVRYATPQLLALEADTLARAVARQHTGVAVVDADTLQGVLAGRPSLSDEQRQMIERLTTSGAGVDVVIGKAGAGKTYALDATRRAWQTSGHPVVGCALAARAAAELEAGAGIDSYTIAGLLADLDRHDVRRWLSPSTVIVVDEAGMVGTRTLARLLDHAEDADAKVVLVGDHHQLPEIDAGGLFRGLAHRLDAIELRDNRRQTHAWERDALDELRDGDPGVAIAAYTAHDRIVVADNADAVRHQLVEDWWAGIHHRLETDGAASGIMVAARRADVDDLNTRARQHLADAGELSGPALVAGDDHREFRVGDHVMTLRNDQRLGVVNGTRGRITALDTDDRTVTIDVDGQQRTITLPSAYLDAGHLTHGYAITAHKAQGATADRAFVLGSDALYREWGYVALSRARHDNRLYLVDHRGNDHTTDLDRHGTLRDARDPLRAAATALERSQGHTLASDHAVTVTIDELRERADQLGRSLRGIPPDPTSARVALAAEHAAARDAHTAAEARLADAVERAATARRGLGRLFHRDTITEADRDVARATAERDAWCDRLGDLTDRAAAFDEHAVTRQRWMLDHADELTDYAATIDQIAVAEHAETTIAELEAADRPDTPLDRDLWRDHVDPPGLDPALSDHRHARHRGEELGLDIA